ncbi:hypothetical protein TorRG33x02_279580 [Trema orientale]|uniref:RNase H type-1 domain-containing protein n=1 Tax=Trema orientale TaxID=63057 RepID=A0A2P5CMT1_TREOI|nr:hypothetical protein TorRG33x02_279580 [Trema orientale]
MPCSHARMLWRLTQLRIDFQMFSSVSFSDILHSMSRSLTNNELEKSLCLLWCVWEEQNQRFHNGKHRDAAEILNWAENYVCSYRLAQQKRNTKALIPGHSNSVKHWQAPLPGSFKMNVDASLLSNNRGIGVGAVIRYFAGQVAHVCHSANEAAHSLAKYALGIESECIWWEELHLLSLLLLH